MRPTDPEVTKRFFFNLHVHCFLDFPGLNDQTDSRRKQDDRGSFIVKKVQEDHSLEEDIDKNGSDWETLHGLFILPEADIYRSKNQWVNSLWELE